MASDLREALTELVDRHERITETLRIQSGQHASYDVPVHTLREILTRHPKSAMESACECYPYMEPHPEMPYDEPTFQPNPDCPQHFPRDAPSLAGQRERITNALRANGVGEFQVAEAEQDGYLTILTDAVLAALTSTKEAGS